MLVHHQPEPHLSPQQLGERPGSPGGHCLRDRTETGRHQKENPTVAQIQQAH